MQNIFRIQSVKCAATGIQNRLRSGKTRRRDAFGAQVQISRTAGRNRLLPEKFPDFFHLHLPVIVPASEQPVFPAQRFGRAECIADAAARLYRAGRRQIVIGFEQNFCARTKFLRRFRNGKQGKPY